MASRSRNLRRAVSHAGRTPRLRKAASQARGRLDQGLPIAVIDIGSNSVRLVVYEGLTRNLTPIFNEKVLAGLGRQVQTTGAIAADGIQVAYAALRRFRALCDTLEVGTIYAMATAACRDAANGPAFITEAERICGVPVEVLTGKQEARYTALGVVSGMFEPNGFVADLGGGSLELVDVHGGRIATGATLPLGGLSLLDVSARSPKRAQKIVTDRLKETPALKSGARRTLYAVGGTWRALARLHMWQRGYPLHVMHGYVLPAKEAIAFCRRIRRGKIEGVRAIQSVAKARRPLLPYAALVLEGVLRVSKAKQVVISVLGVREGLLYSLLPPEERRKDALIEAARELNELRSRSPRHGEELIMWTDRMMKSAGIDETVNERRLRHAACLMADIGWRAHPDYRGEQSLNIIANAGFAQIDHPGRAFLALAVYFRHAGDNSEELSPRLVKLATPRLLERAHLLGMALRVAFQVSASHPGVLPKAPLIVRGRVLALKLSGELAALGGERVLNRLKPLARAMSKTAAIVER